MYQKFFKVLLITLLVALLTSCGPGTSPRSTRTNVCGTSTTTSSLQGSGAIAFNIACLHVQSDYGIQCYNHEASWFPTERANLVLADNRLKYDGPELQQMMKFATAYYNGSLYGPGKPYPALPSTLSYAWGGTKLFLSNLGWIGCFEEIALTNIGKDTIEIQSMNVRLTAAPQPNNKQYRLVDVCSLLPSSSMKELGCPLQKGGGALSYYYFQLNPANVDHIFSSQAPNLLNRANNHFPPNNLNSVLEPSDTEVIDLLFDSSPSSFIYPIMPELTIGTSNGPQSIAMPLLAGKLYFADYSQFSCYTLQGNIFVKEADEGGPFVGSKGLCV